MSIKEVLPAPNVAPTSSSVGQVSASTQANYPRRLQVTMKFIF